MSTAVEIHQMIRGLAFQRGELHGGVYTYDHNGLQVSAHSTIDETQLFYCGQLKFCYLNGKCIDRVAGFWEDDLEHEHAMMLEGVQ